MLLPLFPHFSEFMNIYFLCFDVSGQIQKDVCIKMLYIRLMGLMVDTPNTLTLVSSMGWSTVCSE